MGHYSESGEISSLIVFVVRDKFLEPVAVFNTYKEAYLYCLGSQDFTIAKAVVD
jgi:hypothetical protein